MGLLRGLSRNEVRGADVMSGLGQSVSWPIRLRKALLLPFDSRWNAWVRDATAEMEGWRIYFARGRGQIRIGIWRPRYDRASPEYRFVSLGWNR